MQDMTTGGFLLHSLLQEQDISIILRQHTLPTNNLSKKSANLFSKQSENHTTTSQILLKNSINKSSLFLAL